MNFLIDAQLPPALCGWMRERGHQAVHVFEIGMVAASDAEIAARAEADGAVHESFVALRLPDRFAFLWLRCGNATNWTAACLAGNAMGPNRDIARVGGFTDRSPLI